MRLIDTDDFAQQMRGKIIRPNDRTVLVSRISGTEQEADLQVPPNCGGLGRVRHFKMDTSEGWPANPLPILPACKALGIEDCTKIEAQVFQNNACAWRCWYCFVPYKLLNGNGRTGEWASATDLIQLFRAEANRPPMIDLSGGSPDLTPEWIVWVMEALIEAGLSDQVYLWSDDNLSTDYTFTKLSSQQIELIRNYRNYGRVCCFKGFDEASFSFNTKAEPQKFGVQFDIFRRLLDLGIDIYAYVTLTGADPAAPPTAIPLFIDRLQAIHPLLPLRTVPLEITTFGTTKARVKKDRNIPAADALAVQADAISRWNAEIVARFSADERRLSITDVELR